MARAWREGILFWKPGEAFQKECQITWAVMVLIFILVILPLLLKSTYYGVIGLILYLFLLGFVNFGLKKLSES